MYDIDTILQGPHAALEVVCILIMLFFGCAAIGLLLRLRAEYKRTTDDSRLFRAVMYKEFDAEKREEICQWLAAQGATIPGDKKSSKLTPIAQFALLVIFLIWVIS